MPGSNQYTIAEETIIESIPNVLKILAWQEREAVIDASMAQPLSSDLSAYKTVKAKFWPGLSG